MRASRRSNPVDLDCEIVAETERAVAIRGAEDDWLIWLPRSLTEINDDGTIAIPEWLAMDLGLI